MRFAGWVSGILNECIFDFEYDGNANRNITNTGGVRYILIRKNNHAATWKAKGVHSHHDAFVLQPRSASACYESLM